MSRGINAEQRDSQLSWGAPHTQELCQRSLSARIQWDRAEKANSHTFFSFHPSNSGDAPSVYHEEPGQSLSFSLR